MEKVSINFQTELHMMVTLKTIYFKVKELSKCLKDNIRAHLIKERSKAMVYLLGKMGQNMKVNTKTIKSMVKGSIFPLMEKNMRAIGKREYVKVKVY